jgi:hypothetical protein
MNPKILPKQGKFLPKENGATTQKPLLIMVTVKLIDSTKFPILRSSALISAATTIIPATRLCYVK